MKLRPDDDIYRARLVYLGPPGYTLPFHLPYAQYGLFAALCAVLGGGTWLLTGSSLWAAWAVAVALFLTGYIWTHVDPDRPVTRVLRVVALDWRRTATEPDALPRLTATHVRIRSDLDERDAHERGAAVPPRRALPPAPVRDAPGALPSNLPVAPPRPVAQPAAVERREAPRHRSTALHARTGGQVEREARRDEAVPAVTRQPSHAAARYDSPPRDLPAGSSRRVAQPRVTAAPAVHREVPPPQPARIRSGRSPRRARRDISPARAGFIAALIVLAGIGAVGFAFGWGVL